MRIFPKTLTLGLMLVASAHATQVEIILDASGSMYTKLENGQSRIQVARSVLSGFIASLPDDPQLNVGLRVYGGKTTEGSSCEDSQLVLPISGINRTALQDTVRKTAPKGATPIAYSLQQAASDFAPGDDRKVIVLVTDGMESCGGDLKASLNPFKERGLEVDLRIIGIDLDAKAQQAFQGLGTFENTTTATGLARALGKAVEQVVQVVDEKAQLDIQLTQGGAPFQSSGTVTLTSAAGGERLVLQAQNTTGLFGGQVRVGSYSLHINTPAGVRSYSGVVVNPGQNSYRFEAADPAKPVRVTVHPSTPVMGSTITVDVQNVPEDGLDAYLRLVHPEDPDFESGFETYVGSQNGQFNVRLPEAPETLEFRYVRNRSGEIEVLGRSSPFTPRDVPATLKIANQVNAGDLLQVAWTGPANGSDYLTVVKADAPDGAFDVTLNLYGQPAVTQIRLPFQPGQYELRYMTPAGRVLGRAKFTAVQGKYSLQAPAKVKVGQDIEVQFQGPGLPNDHITLVPKEAPADRTDQHFMAEQLQGKGTLRVPQTPGEYQIRYNNGIAGQTFAVLPLTVEGVEYSVSAPKSAPAGTQINIQWKGAIAPGDYLTIVPRDTPDGHYLQTVSADTTGPVQMTVPVHPGEYELRYQSSGLNNQVMARTLITAVPRQITLTYPASVMAGSLLRVTPKGPFLSGDYLTVVPDGAPDGTYLAHVPVDGGNPVLVQTPEDAGEYEVRYMNSQNDGMVVYRQKITLTEAKATLKGPATARAGSTVKVTWTGPGASTDRVVIARKDSDASEWISEITLGQVIQLDIGLPEETGEFEVRYLTQGGKVLAALPIKVQ
ncbi:VWA domain-containing protein [Deinococcus cellulosilyticus]|uniref:VWFA domain-containing protein n=1 Tax=Deinococcus cellulosilyticus (strain DSM 18568 / NBRC 106333 / KACC 11606 / 5516J-15) TaxID=1223518 RepID=A0A511N6A6_DEIC1|nr:VWA domain-containing protein [Deinococcus cellulosilyticus]GEM48373.1 hypothetical protein DC3_40080 [Deinococcus cellulosilyticus NBRC 106333 = KACC 11606]